jgi:hypothetical protein
MNRTDHDRIRAYLDGELSPEASQALLHAADHDAELKAELASQRALQRMLRALPTPPIPPSVMGAPKRPAWLAALLGLRPLRLSVPAAAAAGLLLFASGTWFGQRQGLREQASPVHMTPVRFVFTGSASQVSVAGTFNGWSVTATPLRAVGDGIWEATVPLPAGEHRYIFQVDGSWQADPLAEQLVPDGLGHLDAVIQL